MSNFTKPGLIIKKRSFTDPVTSDMLDVHIKRIEDSKCIVEILFIDKNRNIYI